MNKGFTLIELLIVVVMVGVLVGIGLPKYQRAAERGRALEGLNNARYVADYIYTKQLVSGVTPQSVSDIVSKKNFEDPVIVGNTVTVSRKSGSGWSYSFVATFDTEGNVTVVCSPSSPGDDTCTQLGF